GNELRVLPLVTEPLAIRQRTALRPGHEPPDGADHRVSLVRVGDADVGDRSSGEGPDPDREPVRLPTRRHPPKMPPLRPPGRRGIELGAMRGAPRLDVEGPRGHAEALPEAAREIRR